MEGSNFYCVSGDKEVTAENFESFVTEYYEDVIELSSHLIALTEVGEIKLPQATQWGELLSESIRFGAHRDYGLLTIHFKTVLAGCKYCRLKGLTGLTCHPTPTQISSSYDRERALFYKGVLEKAVAKGIVVLTSTSNSNGVDSQNEVELPCSLANGLPGVLCVAATVTTEPMVLAADASKLASFGVPATDVVYPTRKYDGDHWVYRKNWGSSAAAAAAAGIVVLIKSFKNFRPQEIERILLNSTEGRVRTKAGDEMSYGLLRPEVAIEQAIAEATWSQASVLCSVHVVSDDG
ncbi:hypothetical protein FOZ60_010263 [Perkinsus olseni]|uniref:subtilisin n=1 Tax=Perkinsus olseni TaxID=32597 RepID=A0A7J6NFI3_PEROL|nr:hypothetical protein FOZ60_010263 [Perkinsus olseni]